MGETVDKNAAIETRKRGVRFVKSDFDDSQKLNGVMLYLYDKGYKDPKKAHEIIKEYGDSIDHVPVPKANILSIALKIQDNFPSFVTWFKGSNYAICTENTAGESGAKS